MGLEADFDEAQSDLRWLADHGALAGVHEILHERRYQLELGWTLAHDDQRVRGELAGLAYDRAALVTRARLDGTSDPFLDEHHLRAAGALCAAEIDRLCRMFVPGKGVAESGDSSGS